MAAGGCSLAAHTARTSRPPAPQGFPQWAAVMDTWGEAMMGAVRLVARAAAVGFGLEPNSLTSLMDEGPHLLAPTGSDLGQHRQLGTVLAGKGPGGVTGACMSAQPGRHAKRLPAPSGGSMVLYSFPSPAPAPAPLPPLHPHARAALHFLECIGNH
jgi:hypothetical protein